MSMQLTIDALTVGFGTLDRATLLADWEWLVGPRKLPILLTAGGDAFVQDEEDGRVYFLDVVDGTVEHVAASEAALRTLLAEKEFVLDYFNVDLVADQVRMSNPLAPGEIYSYSHPPVLGGKYERENVSRTDIAVHFSVTGQIHRKVHGLPAETVIKGISTS